MVIHLVLETQLRKFGLCRRYIDIRDQKSSVSLGNQCYQDKLHATAHRSLIGRQVLLYLHHYLNNWRLERDGSYSNTKELVGVWLIFNTSVTYIHSWRFGLSKDPSHIMKLLLYNSLKLAGLLYGAKVWMLSRMDAAALAVFERKIQRKTFGPSCWR